MSPRRAAVARGGACVSALAVLGALRIATADISLPASPPPVVTLDMLPDGDVADEAIASAPAHIPAGERAAGFFGAREVVGEWNPPSYKRGVYVFGAAEAAAAYGHTRTTPSSVEGYCLTGRRRVERTPGSRTEREDAEAGQPLVAVGGQETGPPGPRASSSSLRPWE